MGDLFWSTFLDQTRSPSYNLHQAIFCTGLLHPISLDEFLHPISISAPDSDFLLSATMIMMMRTR